MNCFKERVLAFTSESEAVRVLKLRSRTRNAGFGSTPRMQRRAALLHDDGCHHVPTANPGRDIRRMHRAVLPPKVNRLPDTPPTHLPGSLIRSFLCETPIGIAFSQKLLRYHLNLQESSLGLPLKRDLCTSCSTPLPETTCCYSPPW